MDALPLELHHEGASRPRPLPFLLSPEQYRIVPDDEKKKAIVWTPVAIHHTTSHPLSFFLSLFPSSALTLCCSPGWTCHLRYGSTYALARLLASNALTRAQRYNEGNPKKLRWQKKIIK